MPFGDHNLLKIKEKCFNYPQRMAEIRLSRMTTEEEIMQVMDVDPATFRFR
jgi:hypothetical protein